MTTNAQMIASENQRRRIPDRWLTRFNDLTDAELLDLSENAERTVRIGNDGVKFITEAGEIRAWAGWELEYREAFGISVAIDLNGKLARRKR